MKMTTKASAEVYRCDLFWVTDDKVRADDGFQLNRSVVRHAGSAVAMPVDTRNRVLLIRQYRVPAARWLWELPAGKVDPGETTLRAAKRELAEETGYRARQMKKLASFFPSPGFLQERMTIYLATGLTAGVATPTESERIETRWFTSQEVAKMIRTGKIEDAKTIIGFLTWKAR
jgi:ADP-ribose pyrophosphatase